MKKYIVLFALISNFAISAPKPPCPPYVWGGPTPTNCVDITYPNPMGGQIDMLEWMTVNPLHRGKIVMEPGYAVNHVVNNKIIYTKFNDLGNFADIWTFDDDYIYYYTTYGPQPPNGVLGGSRANSPTDDPLLPRLAQLGMPGVRLVSEGGNFRVINGCESTPVIPMGNNITELWGPFQLYTQLGDAGFSYVSMRNYWDCQGTTPESCTQEEDYWYMQDYGWINWTAYEAKNRDGKFVYKEGGTLWGPKPGTSALPDWCLSPSLFALDPPPRVHKPIVDWYIPAIVRLRAR